MANPISQESEDRWVNESLAKLAPPAHWQPHADRAFERLMQRQSGRNRQRWVRFSLAGATLAAAGIIIVLLPWSTLWTPDVEVPVNKVSPMEARPAPVPSFAAEINVAPTPAPLAMGKPVAPPEPLVFKPIPPLPEVPPTEAPIAGATSGGKKTVQNSKGVLAEAATGGQQESPQSGVTQPVVVTQVQPAYTQEAREAKVTGSVELVCTVRTDGSVTVDQVTKGLGYGLDEAARDAVNQWRFLPAKKDGTPVEVVITILVNFSLRK